MFSFANTSCARNHQRYTICGYHSGEGHPGRWQDCEPCRESLYSFGIEDYVWRATNSYNFLEERLTVPPAFETSHCSSCGKMVYLGAESHAGSGPSLLCATCSETKFTRLGGRFAS